MAAYISFQPSDFFNPVLYTGNYGVNTITGVGFQPGWTVLKQRDATDSWYNFDAPRGATKSMYWDLTTAEETEASSLTAFNSDGFVLGADNAVNQNGSTFVGYNWKAGTTTGIDTTGSTITPSAYSFNATAGISIVKYTGNDTAGATVPHGLGVAPDMVIVKCLGSANSWVVQHKSLGPTKYMYLDTTAAAVTATNRWNDTAPTAVNVVLGSTGNTNGSGGDSPIIMYSCAEKKGFSKFGSYTGNGDADGAFVYTGFRPAFILTKLSSGSDSWYAYDSKRLGYNPRNDVLTPNSTAAEFSTQRLEIFSNGFKLVSTNGDVNGDGSSYIYAAFAEFPLVSSNSKAGVAR